MAIDNLTPQQQSAIDEKGNILVSAAAGSGKTAVLVERVIDRLCSKENYIPADRLLIVTFTNAAAAEMRSRIEKRLDEECLREPDNTALLLQRYLLSSAKICTIDSFCIDFVRENFEKLGISPDFTISEGSVLQSINERVLSQLLEEYFNNNTKEFEQLLDLVGSEFDEGKLSEFILGIYEYSRQLPFPDKWLDSLCDDYESGSFTENNRWRKYAVSKAYSTVISMREKLANAIDLLFTEEKFADKFMPSFTLAGEELLKLQNTLETNDWDAIYNSLSSFYVGPLPTVRGSNDLPEIKAAKEIYDGIRTKESESLNKLIFAPSQFIDKQFKMIYPAVCLLTEIVKEFSVRVFEAYKEENTFTFHNTESMALQLLCDENDGNVVIKPEAEEFLNLFEEVCVDEYQDTNDLQNMLFYVLSKGEEKLFAVGDVKQSIYGFRGANPQHFLKMKKSHIPLDSAKENDPKKIILSNNFRSEGAICEFINYFFGIFMTENTGEIVYDSEEMLVPSGTFPRCEKPRVSMDIIEVSTGDDKKISEARQIAEFIKEKMSAGAIIPKDKETLRNAKYSDFSILLRSMKGNAGIIAEELRRQGIPVNFSGEGFCEFTEISLMLSLLKIISNPANDVELLTVMMSPMFGFSADEMAEIRMGSPKSDLYTAVNLNSASNEKTANFLSEILKFRLFAVTNTLPQLISILYDETGILNTVLAYSDGTKRRNNLLLLLEYAKSYASVSNGSIKGFTDYIVKQNKRGIKSAVGVSGEDAVKIMSIHASKGLQFPICIISGTSGAFNASESREKNVYSAKYGIGFKYFDETDKKVYTTVSREAIISQIKQERFEEELRLLYVAMTRAQNILHFTAVTTNLEKKCAAVKSGLLANNGVITKDYFAASSSYFDWLLISVMLHPDGEKIRGCGNKIICRETDSHISVTTVNSESLAENKTVENITKTEINSELSEEVKRNIGYEYPFESLASIRSKASVTAITHKAQSEKYNFTSRPSFMSEGGLSAPQKGTALHKTMEFFDFSKWQSPTEEIERLCEWDFLSRQEAESVDVSALERFFAGNIFKRIMNSKNVQREMRFMTELPATDVNPDLDGKFKQEKILVQGAVDICFEEDDGIVILDFKTDRNDDPKAFVDAYSEQLNIYAIACEKIFKKAVKEKIIYSFSLGVEIQV